MSAEIIKFALNEKPEEPPHPDFVRTDDEGRELFYFMIHYKMGQSRWSCRIWAYSQEDAQSRLDAIKESGVIAGQVYAEI